MSVLPLELIEVEVARFLPFACQQSLAFVCRRFSRAWRRAVKQIPPAIIGFYLTDDEIAGFVNLTELNLCGIDDVTDRTFETLSGLQALHLDYNVTISDTGLKKLANLRFLNLSYNSA